MRERFPKLGLSLLSFILISRSDQVNLLLDSLLILCQFFFLCSQSSRLPGGAGSMGYWTMVPFHFYEYASLGKWSGFMLYLLNCVA